jgi:hypothetical protein
MTDMNEQNKEHAEKLRKLADIYESSEKTIPSSGLHIFVDTKEELINAIKAIGGMFTKETGETWVTLRSERIHGLNLNIWRDSVCRKIVTYQCEPLLSPEDEAEVMIEATGARV